MKLYPIAILLLCAFQANAQGWKDKVFGNKNQLEIGTLSYSSKKRFP